MPFDRQKCSKLDIHLFDNVDPEQSSFKLLSTKIEIKLKKRSPFLWDDLSTRNERARQITSLGQIGISATPYASKVSTPIHPPLSSYYVSNLLFFVASVSVIGIWLIKP